LTDGDVTRSSNNSSNSSAGFIKAMCEMAAKEDEKMPSILKEISIDEKKNRLACLGITFSCAMLNG
jgi:hypothetical protein